ncbi:hypothetical protein GC175_33755 [bacterium]|nr:hypothetical protein [bacterium]
MDLALPNDFKEFLRLLNSYQVEYLLIGGYAVGYHGYPRATNDMDVWVAIHPDNAERLVNVMQAFGFSTPELTAELFLQEQKIIRMGNPPMRIELLTSISGVSFAECYDGRIVDELDGVPVNIIALDDLKQNKQASGRYKDLSDLEHLP